ncbi:hypothetical protein OS242_13745 [Tumebacillus sp. DT12]|uniref:Uncharacterized protein n=1 Tax=Tumebacillus lacus TaxID=2995335 RepID=A0ABT3X258_9BACL|nr:hypothetical protein [Tumebacillus lacus]MCX7571008.1 hypothetical protein [Tumebacillus lacus]
MKSFKTLLVVAVTSATVLSATTASAAVDADGRYRDGAEVNYLNHAGLRKAGAGIYEIKGYNETIQLSTWDSFIAGNNYIGSFWNPNGTESKASSILNTAAAMDADPGITYTLYDMLNYESTAGTYITVDEITDIRCDGVVEYAYEWNNVWVWGRSSDGTTSGTPQHHDISLTSYTSEHNNLGGTGTIELSPYVQRGGSGLKWTTMRETGI